MFKRAIYFIVLLFFSLSAFAEESINLFIEKELKTYKQLNGIPGLAAVVYEKGLPHYYIEGLADKAKKIKVSRKTIFELGSVSKLFTTLLLAQEVDMAHAQLNDPITKYLDELPADFNKITLLDCATHTAGLPFELSYKINNYQDALNYFKKHKVLSHPKQWQYSNLSIGLIGKALERITHQNYNQLYRRHILNPLHMQPIGLIVPKAWVPYYAQGYDQKGEPVPHQSLDAFPTANGLKASLADMSHFLSASLGLKGTPERVLYPMRLTQMAYYDLPEVSQGLGWKIHELQDAKTTLSAFQAQDAEVIERPYYEKEMLMDKTGATKGFRSYIAITPYNQSGIVILVNKAIPDNSIAELGKKILNEINRKS